MKVKRTYTKKMIKGSGIVTDIGNFAFPALAGLAGGTLGSALGPVGTVLGEAGGSALGMSLNEWLKSKGLGNSKAMQGNGIASDILKKAQEQLAPKVYKTVVNILSKGLDVAKEIDSRGLINTAQKWLNLYRMGKGKTMIKGRGYSYTPLSVGTKTVQNYQGTTMLPVPTFNSIGQVSYTPATKGKMKGKGNQTQFGTVSSEYGNIKV